MTDESIHGKIKTWQNKMVPDKLLSNNLSKSPKGKKNTHNRKRKEKEVKEERAHVHVLE
jgi:hypothetical protein